MSKDEFQPLSVNQQLLHWMECATWRCLPSTLSDFDTAWCWAPGSWHRSVARSSSPAYARDRQKHLRRTQRSLRTNLPRDALGLHQATENPSGNAPLLAECDCSFVNCSNKQDSSNGQAATTSRMILAARARCVSELVPGVCV